MTPVFLRDPRASVRGFGPRVWQARVRIRHICDAGSSLSPRRRSSSSCGRRRGGDAGALARTEGGRALRAVDGDDARLRRRRRHRRPLGPRARLRHGRPRARRPQHARHDLRGRVGVEAVHRGGGGAARRATARSSLDDAVRKYIPELPDYGTPLTIRHMLNHTSGLRDWGSLAGIAGWPRGSRVHTHAHVVEILEPADGAELHAGRALLVQQLRLQPVRGARLARERDVVRRVQPAAPLRAARHDAHVVARRLHARREGSRDRVRAATGDGSRQDMPFENVHGNGGLLTTVGDLLRWNENFVDAEGRRRRVREAAADDGAVHVGGRCRRMRSGLMIGSYKGVREVSHSGSTAGYRAFLTRFPDENVSVAVLCNAGTANPTQLAHAAADLYLGDRAEPVGEAVAGARGDPRTGDRSRARRHVQAECRGTHGIRRDLSERRGRDDAGGRGAERRPRRADAGRTRRSRCARTRAIDSKARPGWAS